MLNSLCINALFIMRLGLNLGLLALLSYYVTYTLLTWQYPISTNAQAQTNNDAPTNLSARATSTTYLDVVPLTHAQLFGQTSVTNKPVVDTTPQNLPTTSLNLTLRGVVYHEDPNLSLAMIQIANKTTKKYRVGEFVQPQVKLHAIHSRKVVLFRHGQYETLLLKGDDTRQQSQINNTPLKPSNPITSDKTPEQLLKRYQQQLRSSPQSLLRLARVKPMKKNGRFIGYRLRPNHDEAVFQTFGLQSGDILTAVNGIKLDSPLKGLSVIQQLANTKQLNLELRRNGQTLDLSFSLE